MPPIITARGHAVIFAGKVGSGEREGELVKKDASSVLNASPCPKTHISLSTVGH